MIEKNNSLPAVFGVSRNIPETYVLRPDVDERFVNDLARFKHIVIHGSSKQGKTTLRKYHLLKDDFVVIQCTRNTTKESIYETLLKLANIGVSSIETTKKTKGTQVKVTLGAEGKIPFITKIDGGAEASKNKNNELEISKQSFNIDLSNPNDIIRALSISKFKKYVVLEDFHYLPDNIQETIAYDLKAFNDNSPYVFIIIGVWLESNKLLLYNGDLSGRLNTIAADRWKDEEFREIITSGESLLNIKINSDTVDEIIKCCYGNVGLFQEITYRICEEYKVWKTQEKLKIIGNRIDVRAVLRQLSKEESPRYINFITNFCEETINSKFNISTWVMKYIISCGEKELSKGIRLDTVYKKIQKVHPYGFKIKKSSLSQFFGRIDKIQRKYKVQPVILEYSYKQLC